jgi:hypothetical protein
VIRCPNPVDRLMYSSWSSLEAEVVRKEDAA